MVTSGFLAHATKDATLHHEQNSGIRIDPIPLTVNAE
jgi:hypothetical protein